MTTAPISLRQQIINALTAAKAPGVSVYELSNTLGVAPTAVMHTLKKLRADHPIEATANPDDLRLKTYRIATKAKARKPKATTGPKVARPLLPALSSTELEAAICAKLGRYATRALPMPMGRVVHHTGQPHEMVRPALIALVQRQTVTKLRGGYYLTAQPEQAAPPSPPTVAAPRVICNAAMPNGDAAYWARMFAPAGGRR